MPNEQIKAGAWVEIEQILLTPEQRTTKLPEDTAKCPYVMRVSGFVLENSMIGQNAKIKTRIGNIVEGKITCLNPSYLHNFGETVNELIDIGVNY